MTIMSTPPAPETLPVELITVTIDGVDVRDATLASLRGAIALVSQETTLFHDTIRANIAYGAMGTAGEAEIVADEAKTTPEIVIGGEA